MDEDIIVSSGGKKEESKTPTVESSRQDTPKTPTVESTTRKISSDDNIISTSGGKKEESKTPTVESSRQDTSKTPTVENTTRKISSDDDIISTNGGKKEESKTSTVESSRQDTPKAPTIESTTSRVSNNDDDIIVTRGNRQDTPKVPTVESTTSRVSNNNDDDIIVTRGNRQDTPKTPTVESTTSRVSNNNDDDDIIVTSGNRRGTPRPSTPESRVPRRDEPVRPSRVNPNSNPDITPDPERIGKIKRFRLANGKEYEGVVTFATKSGNFEKVRLDREIKDDGSIDQTHKVYIGIPFGHNVRKLEGSYTPGVEKSNQLSNAKLRALNRLAQEEKAANRDVKVSLYGTADASGSSKYNEKLSNDRINEVTKLMPDVTVEESKALGENTSVNTYGAMDRQVGMTLDLTDEQSLKLSKYIEEELKNDGFDESDAKDMARKSIHDYNKVMEHNDEVANHINGNMERGKDKGTNPNDKHGDMDIDSTLGDGSYIANLEKKQEDIIASKNEENLKDEALTKHVDKQRETEGAEKIANIKKLQKELASEGMKFELKLGKDGKPIMLKVPKDFHDTATVEQKDTFNKKVAEYTSDDKHGSLSLATIDTKDGKFIYGVISAKEISKDDLPLLVENKEQLDTAKLEHTNIKYKYSLHDINNKDIKPNSTVEYIKIDDNTMKLNSGATLYSNVVSNRVGVETDSATISQGDNKEKDVELKETPKVSAKYTKSMRDNRKIEAPKHTYKNSSTVDHNRPSNKTNTKTNSVNTRHKTISNTNSRPRTKTTSVEIKTDNYISEI